MQKNFDSISVHKKWSDYWLENESFSSQPDDRPSYTIVMPPPNVTGVLHFGHVLNNSLQDFFIRKAKKEGYNALWVPGVDHASIATESKVVAWLKEEGLKKSDLTREAFFEKCKEWKEKYGGIIIHQLKTIGAACDWSRLSYTLDDHYYDAVIEVFIDLYNKGYIYRGKRIINWDCEAQTALSNEEVVYSDKPEMSKLYYLKYLAEDNKGKFLTIATTRPETIFADAAIAVNPNDKNNKEWIGKKVLIPLLNKAITVIADDYVDSEFGTGCLKVTPAHDINDYEISQRHNLEVIDILNDDGSLNEACQYEKYVGKDRFVVRKQIAKELEESGNLLKIEEIENKVGRSERTNSIVEPKLSLQWYVAMKDLSKKAHEVVMSDEVEFFPSYHKNSYNHWMNNIRDWCISRQLWWGHRIPVYYLPNGEYVVAKNLDEAFEKAKAIQSDIKKENLKQDEDVLDTWASSWLWPLEVFNGFNSFNEETGKIDISKNNELEYYQPTKILVTAPEIMNLWVMRMTIANYEYLGTKPFEKVYFTGIVRDKLGRKMSKSLGNSPDINEAMEKYGMDGIRYGMMSISPAGNDIIFDEKALEVGRNFSNKIWNAMRLIKSWEIEDGENIENIPTIHWFEELLQSNINNYLNEIEGLRISEAIKGLYSFVWNDFCSWYLEFIKPNFGEKIDRATYDKSIYFFKQILSLLNPIMPFVTEEIWQEINEDSNDKHCFEAKMPESKDCSEIAIAEFEKIKEFIVKVREVRAKLQLKNTEKIAISIDKNLKGEIENYLPKSIKLLNIDKLDTDIDQSSSNTTLVAHKKVIIHSEKKIDTADAKAKIEKDILYYEGFVKSIEKKLSNERFVSNAPAQVVENEKNKLKDGVAQLEKLKENLSSI